MSHREGTTLFITLLAAFNTLLHRYTDRQDIIVGSPIANRTRAETQGLMGFFINTLALRTDLSGDPTFIELLKRVREIAFAAYAHQDLPFEKLVDELDTERSLSYTPLFQVIFVLQNFTTETLQLPGLQLSQEDTHPGTSKFDLTMQLVEFPGGIQATAEYRLLNFYGSSEVAGDASYHEVGEAEAGSVVGIGEPISNTRIYVLSREGMPVGAGEAGELMIAGESLARGYLKRAELTAERFLPDPYGEQAGARMYASGDVGSRRADGLIDYMGRRDNQVKVRGYRVELGEVEYALLSHEGVEESAVIARTEAGEVRLEGYVVVKAGEHVSGKALRRYLKGRVIEPMVPAVITAVEEMPRTASGKVDRARLPKAEVRSEEVEYRKPGDVVEEVLARIWAEVLKVEKVGVDDRFFDLGGHSLLATQIISRVRVEFDMELALRELIERPTVAELAEVIKQKQQETKEEMASIADVLEGIERLSDQDISILLGKEIRDS